MAFFIEYLDTSVKTIDDVERALQAPVLGVIPQNIGNILEEGSETPHAEAYRVLRTNILFSRKNESWNTISMLSGGAGEGKSTTLFNLAVIFAQNGQQVLVVDSDLRRPVHSQAAAPAQYDWFDRFSAQAAHFGRDHSEDQNAHPRFYCQRQAAQQFDEHFGFGRK